MLASFMTQNDENFEERFNEGMAYYKKCFKSEVDFTLDEEGTLPLTSDYVKGRLHELYGTTIYKDMYKKDPS